MNNQPRSNSEQESQQQIDQTIELLESLNESQRPRALNAVQQSIVEVGSAARESVVAQLPKSNQALRQQLIEATKGATVTDVKTIAASRPSSTSLPPRRWAASAAVVIGLGITGWYLSGIKTAGFKPSQVAVQDAPSDAENNANTSAASADTPAQPAQRVKQLSSSGQETIELSTNSFLDDLMGLSGESTAEFSRAPQSSAQDGVTVELPKLAETSVNTVVAVPEGGTVFSGGIERKPTDTFQSALARNGKQQNGRWEERESKSGPVIPISPEPQWRLQPSGDLADQNESSQSSEDVLRRNEEKWFALKQRLGDGHPTVKMAQARLDKANDLLSQSAASQAQVERMRARYPQANQLAPVELRTIRNHLALDNSTPHSVRRIQGTTFGDFVAREGKSTEHYRPIYENSFTGATGSDAVSTFSIDVDTASYANTRRFLNSGQLPPPDAVRIEELINYFPYDYAPPTGADPFSVDMEMADCPWQPKHKLVRIGIKGKEVAAEERKATHLVFLLDVSGSMNSVDKLPLLKRGFKMMVDQLKETDRVTIVTYAGQAGLALETTSGDQKSKINAAIDVLKPGGSTHGSAGIELAYQMAQQNFITDGNNKVILATDGDLNVGITEDKPLVDLIKQKASEGVFLTVLGFGTGNLKDGKMEQLADNGNGMYCYIDSVREARKVLVEQMTGSLVTIAKDVKIQVEFNPQEVHSYRLIGYENRLLAAADFDNDRKDAGEIGAGHTVTAIYEVVTRDQADAASVASMALKYQSNKAQEKPEAPVKTDTDLTDAAASGELLTLAMRYKQPDANTSKRIEFTIANEANRFDDASADFRFTASVAAYGMLLRNSEHAGNATAAMVEEIAAGSMGTDGQGYRAEFIDLVRKAQTLLKR